MLVLQRPFQSADQNTSDCKPYQTILYAPARQRQNQAKIVLSGHFVWIGEMHTCPVFIVLRAIPIDLVVVSMQD
jgi:hypothetical protein